MKNEEIARLKSIAEGSSSYDYDMAFWQTRDNVCALFSEIEQLKAEIARLRGYQLEESKLPSLGKEIAASLSNRQQHLCDGRDHRECTDGKCVWNDLVENRQAKPEAKSRPTCKKCGTHEVSLEQTCHNSACENYAVETVVYEGWRDPPKVNGRAGAT